MNERGKQRKDEEWVLGQSYLREFDNPTKRVRKSHIVCLNSHSADYISVGQPHLVSIGFKVKSNNRRGRGFVVILLSAGNCRQMRP